MDSWPITISHLLKLTQSVNLWYFIEWVQGQIFEHFTKWLQSSNLATSWDGSKLQSPNLLLHYFDSWLVFLLPYGLGLKSMSFFLNDEIKAKGPLHPFHGYMVDSPIRAHAYTKWAS